MEKINKSLIIKYEPSKIIWRIFFPYSLVIFIGFGMGIKLIVNGDLGGGVFFSLMGIGAFFIVIELLLTKEFRIESDRIIKIWRIFGSKEIEYKNATLNIVSGKGILKRNCFFAFEEKREKFYHWIKIDRHLISSKTENNIFDSLKALFKHNDRFQENTEIRLISI